MAIVSTAFVADDTAYVKIKNAQTTPATIQWREGPPARIVVAASLPAITDDTYQIIGAKGHLGMSLPALAATDFVYMMADTHVATAAENNGARAGTKTKVSVIA